MLSETWIQSVLSVWHSLCINCESSVFHGSLSTCCRLLHEDTHFWSWTGKESWLWILLKMNGYIFGEHNSWPHHDGRGEYFVGRTWLDCLSEPCWRRCGATWFWLCPKIITFWEDVHLVTVRILDYDFTKSCVLLSLAIWREADDWLKMENEMYVMEQLTHETRI